MLNPQHEPFRKSRRSDAGNCVEVARILDCSGALVRDSKDREGPTLKIPAAGWSAFIAGTKAGRFTIG